MRRSLPLNALRVFEVAARTGSYAEAGTELVLTHGAVSRQIGLLEAWLGQRLFVRTGRRMTPTPAARAFAAEVSLSFDRMTEAAEACGRPSARHLLRVSAPTTFAIRWLIPRLERFHAGAPDVEATGVLRACSRHVTTCSLSACFALGRRFSWPANAAATERTGRMSDPLSLATPSP